MFYNRRRCYLWDVRANVSAGGSGYSLGSVVFREKLSREYLRFLTPLPSTKSGIGIQIHCPCNLSVMVCKMYWCYYVLGTAVSGVPPNLMFD